jgi:hypothetical protein
MRTLLEGGEVVGRVEIGEEVGIPTFDRHRADPPAGRGFVEEILETALPGTEEFLDETEEFRTRIEGGERFPSALGAGHGTCSHREEAGQEIGLHSRKIDGEDEEKVRLARGEDGLQPAKRTEVGHGIDDPADPFEDLGEGLLRARREPKSFRTERGELAELGDVERMAAPTEEGLVAAEAARASSGEDRGIESDRGGHDRGPLRERGWRCPRDR